MKPGAGPQSFPKSLRLLRRAEFRRVYDEGQHRSAPLCSIFYTSNGLPQTRLGITTPRALGTAVVRNRVKRRLREAFRLHRTAIPGGWDIVLNPRRNVATVPFSQLVEQLLRLFPNRKPSSTPRPGSTPTGRLGSQVKSRNQAPREQRSAPSNPAGSVRALVRPAGPEEQPPDSGSMLHPKSK